MRDKEIWELDIRPPIHRKIQAAKDHGRGVTVSPYWLSKILTRLDKYEPPKAYQGGLKIAKESVHEEAK